MISISLCMIVKDEEGVLERCLTSVKDLVDEIIIVDTGSSDKTKEIASKFTDLIYDFKWVNDFSKARNYSFSKATKDYQMWLDADDILLEKDRNKFKKLKSELSLETDVVTMKYNTHFDENNIPIFTSTRGRLFKREKGYTWNDPIHEYIELRGNVFKANDIFVTHKKEAHYTDRNIKIYENQVKEGRELSPRSTYYFARELKDHKRYIEAAYYFNKFLNDGLGWVEDNIGSCYSLGLCYNAIGEKEKALQSFLKSFNYHAPRAEVCCEIGYHYRSINDNEKAIAWFTLATKLEKPDTMGFLLNDYWDYIPNIELVVCYSINKDYKKASYHNQIAKKYKPKSKAVKHNEKYLKEIISNSK